MDQKKEIRVLSNPAIEEKWSALCDKKSFSESFTVVLVSPCVRMVTQGEIQ